MARPPSFAKLWFIFLLFGLNPCWAIGPLTLEDCLQLARQLRPSLQAAQQRGQAATAARQREEASRLPQLGARMDLRETQSLPFPTPIGGGLITTARQRTTTHNAALSLDMTFYQTGQSESIARARASERGSWYNAEDAERTLLADVASLFYAALANRRLAEVAAEGVQASEQHLNMVDAKIEAGTAARSDRLTVEVELAQARLEAIRTETAAQQSLQDLRATIGLRPGPPLNLVGDLRTPLVEDTVEGLSQQALEKRPDLLSQRASAEAADWSLRLAEQRLRPFLSAIGHADYGAHTNVTGESWWVGTSLTFPLFSKSDRADRDVAEANRNAAQSGLTDLELQIGRQVEREYLNLQQAQARIPAAAKAVESAQLNVEVTRERYREGIAIIIEVIDAEQSLLQAQGQHTQALYDYNTARIQVLTAAGESLLSLQGESP